MAGNEKTNVAQTNIDRPAAIRPASFNFISPHPDKPLLRIGFPTIDRV